MRELIIGVDGGGTKTKLSAMDIATGEIVSSSTVGGINSCALTLQGASKNLAEGIRALRLTSQDLVKALSIGDPGIDDSVPNQGIALQKEIAASGLLSEDTQYYSASDVFMALYAFTRGEAGALIVAGTGSMGVAFPQRYMFGAENKIETVGGWGYPVPDKGSGYAIAVDGIEAAMDAYDGIAPATLLTEALKKFFGVSEFRETIGIFNGGGLKKSDIAAFARQVDLCASEGDGIAKKILQRSGTVLGKYAISLLNRVPSEFHRVGTYGSVLVRNRFVRKAFERTVRNTFNEAEICIPDFPPEIGAIYYALDAQESKNRLK